MKILVCGGSGFIGSTFIQNLLKNNSESSISNLDNLSIGSNQENLKDLSNNSRYKFIQDKIQNESVISDLIKNHDIVVNFAAESHVDRSISNPKPFVETNVLGTYSLLEGIRKYDKFFVHVSTDEVYGDTRNQESFNESSQINPSNPYSATKAAADHLVASYYRTYGIKCITTRCSNNFGPMQFPEKLIPKTIIRTIKNLKVPIYGDGKQIRSWIHADDHVNAIQSLIQKGKSGDVYNITAYEEIHNKTIVEKILDILDVSHEMIEFVPDRPGHDKRYSLDSSKLEKQVDWKPKYNFDHALQETVNWYLKNKDWWMSLIDDKVLHPQPWTLNWSK